MLLVSRYYLKESNPPLFFLVESLFKDNFDSDISVTITLIFLQRTPFALMSFIGKQPAHVIGTSRWQSFYGASQSHLG